MLTIQLLGEMTVLHDAETIVLPPSRKTRALLAYLVVSGRAQRRERLCTIFWDVPDDPRGALRWSLSKLRTLVDTATDAPRIVADRETVTFVPDGVVCDVLALRALVTKSFDDASTEALESTAAMIGGEFLEGMDLPSQPDFQAWCLAEREETRRRHAALLRTLVGRLLPESPESALPHARDLVALDGFDADARAGLVRLLARLGRRDEAIQHCETGIRMLREGGLPEGALTSVRRELNARVQHPSPAAGQPVAALPSATPGTAVGAGRLSWMTNRNWGG
jgi:DNA-binding SARP family transcriptional activator